MYFLFFCVILYNCIIWMDVQYWAILVQVPPVKDHLIKGEPHWFYT